MDPDSCEKTAFTTPFSLFQFLVMPFRLHGAPATFQRLVDDLLKDFRAFPIAYLDDIVIFSSSWEEHLQHLRRLMKRLLEVRLTAKPEKCRLAMGEVQYLGYRVGGGQVRPTDEKVQAVRNSPMPVTKN